MNTRVHLSRSVIVTPALAEPYRHLNAEDALAIVLPPLMSLSVENKDQRGCRSGLDLRRRVTLH